MKTSAISLLALVLAAATAGVPTSGYSKPPEGHIEPYDTGPLPGKKEAQVSKLEAELRPSESLCYVDNKGGRLPFRLFPPAGHDKSRKYPVVVYLHGISDPGTDNRLQLSSVALSKALFSEQTQAAHPHFIVAPQHPNDDRWDMHWADKNRPSPTRCLEQTVELLECLKKEFPDICEDEIYLTGVSSGGTGVWEMLECFPDVFSAAVPLSPRSASRAFTAKTAVPVWCFLSQDDEPARINEARKTMSDLRRFPVDARLTEYSTELGLKHSSWKQAWMNVQAYEEDSLVEWLFRQRRGKCYEPEPPSGAALSLHLGFEEKVKNGNAAHDNGNAVHDNTKIAQGDYVYGAGGGLDQEKGALGRAVRFSHDGDGVRLTTTGGAKLATESGTVAFWVSLDSLKTKHVLVDGIANGKNWRLSVEKDSGALSLEVPGTPHAYTSPLAAIPSTGGFHHVVCAFQPGRVEFFVNGRTACILRGKFKFQPEAAGWWLGRSASNPGERLHGAMDEFLVFDKCLHEKEVAGLFREAPHPELVIPVDKLVVK